MARALKKKPAKKSAKKPKRSTKPAKLVDDRLEHPYADEVWAAIETGKLLAITKLLDAGTITPTTHSWTGETVLQCAVSAAQLPIVKLLIERGCPIDHRDQYSERTPLFVACWGAPTRPKEHQRRAVFDYLIEAGADVNGASSSDGTPLHACAMFGNPELAKALIAAGADPSHTDGKGRTPADCLDDQGPKMRKQMLAALGPAAVKSVRPRRADKPKQQVSVKRTIPAIFDALKGWAKDNSQRLANSFEAPVTPAALAALEQAIGQQLPADLRAALQLHDGGPNIDSYNLIGAERIQMRWEGEQDLLKQKVKGGSRKLRPVRWSKGWIPFAEDGGLNFLCIDLDPGPEGKVGQVIWWERRGGQGASDWTSFTDYLGAFADACLSAEVEVDDEGFVRKR